MKRLAILATGLVLAISLLHTPAADTKAAPGPRGPVVHVVSFKFKPETKPEQIKLVETAFAALPGKIQQIRSFEWGTNMSPEKLNKDFTHGFVLTFKTAADRDAYLVHPAHKEFGGIVGPVLADVFVPDFVTQHAQ